MPVDRAHVADTDDLAMIVDVRRERSRCAGQALDSLHHFAPPQQKARDGAGLRIDEVADDVATIVGALGIRPRRIRIDQRSEFRGRTVAPHEGIGAAAEPVTADDLARIVQIR